MKRLFVTMALFGAFAVAGYAQQHPKAKHGKMHEQKSPEEKAKAYTEALDKQLNLTDKQEKEVYELQLKNMQYREKVKLERQEQHKKDREAFKARHDESAKKMNQILTPEQQAAFEKLKAERRGKFEERKKMMKKRVEERRRDSTRVRSKG